MNLRDSEFVMGILIERGFTRAESVEKADVILFNSCSVRKHAEDRLFSNIADLKDLKKKRPGLVIGLMGCAAQSHKEKILRILPMVDIVCGPGNEDELPEIINDVLKNRCSIVALDKINEKRNELFPVYRESAFKTQVAISEGCDNFCSYCIVPYVRGRERSRDSSDIIKEVKSLAARGFKEITLLGQNVNSYRIDHRPQAIGRRPEFVTLLEKLNKVKGIERIRFMTSHPKDASIELFKAMRSLEHVCEHLHLPFQSGSSRILKLMNRGYTRESYLRLIENYRKIVPGGSLTTDVIVGFPSETDKDFNQTLSLMREVLFDSAFSFKYSPRPPAKAAKLKDGVPEEVKGARLKTILDIQYEISLAKNELFKNKTVEVIVDGMHGNDDSCTGRTRDNKIVAFSAKRRIIGKPVNIRIDCATPHGLKGKMVK